MHHILPGLGTNVPPSWNFSFLNPSPDKIEISPTDLAVEPATIEYNDSTAKEQAEPEDDHSHIAIDGQSDVGDAAVPNDVDHDHENTNNHCGGIGRQPSPSIVGEIAAMVNRPGPGPPGALRGFDATSNDGYRERDEGGSPIIYSSSDEDDKMNDDHHAVQ